MKWMLTFFPVGDNILQRYQQGEQPSWESLIAPKYIIQRCEMVGSSPVNPLEFGWRF